MDQLTLTTCAGSVLLIVVAAFPSVARPRVALTLLTLAGSILATTLLVRQGIAFQRYLPDTQPSKLVRYGVKELAKAKKAPAPNLLLIDGGSYAARGINHEVLQRELGKLGYRAQIVQLSLGAANHFERYQVQFDTLRHSGFIEQAPDKQHLVLLAEVQAGYDSKPLAQLQENTDTSRTYQYLTPSSAWLSIQAIHGGGGELGSLKMPVWTVLRHTLINAFNVGVVSRLSRWEKLKQSSGFVPGGAEKGFKFKGLDPVVAAATVPLDDVASMPWLFQIREPRLKRLWGEALDRWVYFAVPSTKKSSAIWSRSFCAATREVCIAVNDAALLHDLDQKQMWRNRGHLSTHGAEVYSMWLARKLAEAGVLQK